MKRSGPNNKRQEKIDHILKKATEAFSQKGYDGASADDIATAAGMSKRSMYYYMGDKNTLYRAVIEEIDSGAKAELKKTMKHSDTLTPHEKLYKYINAVAQIVKNNEIHSVIIRELLSNNTSFLPQCSVEESLGLICKFIDETIEDGVKENVFIRANPMVSGVMIRSVFVYWRIIACHIDKKSEYYGQYIAKYGTDISDALVDEVYRMFIRILSEPKSKAAPKIKPKIRPKNRPRPRPRYRYRYRFILKAK
ncbi:TetR/AcrR family transcriptional regulator [Desulfosarcina ovata]|nr:TetR/AcrR family transcriptional regulator [Desulfosarcina ovata]